MEGKDKKLYPVIFLEDVAEMPWGQVCYQIADLGFKDSMIADGWFGGNTLSELMGTYMERVVGDDAFEYYGLQFPLMVKVMKTTGWQPLQVNIGDTEAEERYDSFGKTSFWYIAQADEDARMFLGLKRDVSAEEFYVRSQDGSVREVLNEIKPVAGDSFLIEPGTVFAAGPGLTIIEIGECSEMGFALQDPLLLEEAFDLIDFHRYVPGGTGESLAKCEVFTVRKMDLRDPLHIFSEQPGSFAIYHCLSGEAAIQPYGDDKDFPAKTFKTGQSILVPSEVNDYLILPTKEGTILLEAVAERRVPRDSYTGDSGEYEDSDAPDPHVRNWN